MMDQSEGTFEVVGVAMALLVLGFESVANEFAVVDGWVRKMLTHHLFYELLSNKDVHITGMTTSEILLIASFVSRRFRAQRFSVFFDQQVKSLMHTIA